jgi:ubiquinone/menaquinone biosynthesis C-methylase UbiE
MMLHELAGPTRAAVLREIRRVLKPAGRLVVFDYHVGPRRFSRGWLNAPFILAAERLAGRDHYRHHREFLAEGGMPAIAPRFGFEVMHARPVKGGNFGVFVLAPTPQRAE